MKLKKEHKKSYDQISSPDSIWSRSAGRRQVGGKEVQDKLSLEDEPTHDIKDKTPLKMMDIVMQMWGAPPPTEEEEEDEG